MSAAAAALQLAVVSLAGGAGCALRVLVRDGLQRRGTRPWWAILAINLAGAFAMGIAMAASGAAPGPRTTIVTGVLAGWTTYSAFAMDAVQLWLRGERRQCAALWFATLAGAPAAAAIGHAAMHALAGGAQ